MELFYKIFRGGNMDITKLKVLHPVVADMADAKEVLVK